jgi:hypothetical protein
MRVRSRFLVGMGSPSSCLTVNRSRYSPFNVVAFQYPEETLDEDKNQNNQTNKPLPSPSQRTIGRNNQEKFHPGEHEGRVHNETTTTSAAAAGRRWMVTPHSPPYFFIILIVVVGVFFLLLLLLYL